MHTCSGLPLYENGTLKCNLTVDEKLDNSKYMNNDSMCINWNQYYTECREGESNPFQGTISFDNIGLAWVSIFLVNIMADILWHKNLSFYSISQVISLEGWTDIMYYVQDAHSFWDWIYFVLLIVVSKLLSKHVFAKYRNHYLVYETRQSLRIAKICSRFFSFSDWFIFYDQPLPGRNSNPIFRNEKT